MENKRTLSIVVYSFIITKKFPAGANSKAHGARSGLLNINPWDETQMHMPSRIKNSSGNKSGEFIMYNSVFKYLKSAKEQSQSTCPRGTACMFSLCHELDCSEICCVAQSISELSREQIYRSCQLV